MKAHIINLLKFLLDKLEPPKFEQCWWPVPENLKVGSRVLINQSSGFSKGLKGTVSYIEPNGRIWVRRVGASSDAFFYPHELDVMN